MDLDKVIKHTSLGDLAIDLVVPMDDAHRQAIDVLSFLYKALPDGATYGDAEEVLVEALWWNNTQFMLKSGSMPNQEKSDEETLEERMHFYCIRHNIRAARYSGSDHTVCMVDQVDDLADTLERW